MVIAFVAEITSDERKPATSEEGEEPARARDSSYENYEDYLDRTFAGGGFYVSNRKETKVGGVEVTQLEIKVEKLTYNGPKRITTWIYHAPGLDLAVQIEVLEDQYKKLKRTIDGALRSFKLIERTGGDLAAGARSGSSWIGLLDMDEGTPEERARSVRSRPSSIAKRPWPSCPTDGRPSKSGASSSSPT